MISWVSTTRSSGSKYMLLEEVLVPGDVEEQVAKGFNFHVILNSAGDETRQLLQVAEIQHSAIYWNSLGLRLADFGSKAPLPVPSIIPASTTQAPKIKRGIKWASSLSFKSPKATTSFPSATTTLVKKSQTLSYLPLTAGSAVPQVSGLCHIVQGGHKRPAVNCYGYILDAGRKFELCPDEEYFDLCGVTSLREVLVGVRQDLPPFDYPQRIKVALALSISILHLYDTPWLAKVVTLDDIVFFLKDCASSTPTYSPYRPFVTKHICEGPSSSPPQHNKPPNSLRPINLTVLSLGALLIQIITGQVIDDIQVADDMDMNFIVSKREAGNRLEDRVLEIGGTNYATAVKWCLESVYGLANLQNDGFCQNFYEEVVSRLEDDITLLESD